MNKIQKLIEEYREQEVTFNINFYGTHDRINAEKYLDKISGFIEMKRVSDLRIHIRTYQINYEKIENVLNNNDIFYKITDYDYI